MKKFTIKTQTELRLHFWAAFPYYIRTLGLKQNDYSATIRTTWVEYVDYNARAGVITEALAARATLA